MKFGKLTLRFRLGCAPDPTGGLTELPQTTYLDLRGPTSKGREGKKDKKERGREVGKGWRCMVFP